jgi:putative ABC transport system ATP-binding protein
MSEAIIRTRDLCKTYVSEGIPFHAVKNVDLEIAAGGFTVIMGSSGHGKSTLLYLLSGLDTVTAGEVWFAGERLDTKGERAMAAVRRRGMGFVFQAINLVPTLTLFENVALPGYLGARDRRAVNERARALLASMGLETQAARVPARVSGGEQQRAAIARGLVNEPRVLFADEPTGNLNSASGAQVLDVLSGLAGKGQTIVMVTHDLKAACRADRVVFLRDGRIGGDLALGHWTPDGGAEREARIFAFLKDRGW